MTRPPPDAPEHHGTTVRVETSERADGDHFELVVVDGPHAATLLLPPQGDLILGRAEDAHVRIDAASVSRRHATLHIGRTLQLEDLGSANGTRVNGARLNARERVDVHPGDALEFGSIRCVLQGAASRPRRVVDHAYFEARLRDECERAADERRTFAVVRVRVDQRPDDASADAVLAAVRPADTVAAYSPWEYEVLLPDTAPDEAHAAARRVAASVTRADRRVEVGVACYPGDARTPEALLARAAVLRAHGADEARAVADDVVVADPVMRELHAQTAQIARSPVSVLLLGETGVGKEVFAARVHGLSPRASGPFVSVNCAVLTESLAESELFGHEKGAFTHAVAAKPGLFESADGGTVFLDEVGELSPENQARLLRVLQERQVRRVGATKTRPVDVRVVAATNRDLEAEIAAGRFRQDLYYRLNGFTLTIPPLRQRVAEVEPLALRFAERAWRAMGYAGGASFAPEAIELLRGYAWPGNVRELCNVVERAVALSGGARITPAQLPTEKLRSAGNSPAARSSATAPPPGLTPDELSERQRILEALERCLHNQTHAARELGIARRTLINKIERYNLPRPRKA